MAFSEYGSEGSVGMYGGTSFVDELVQSERGYARGPERTLLSALLFDGVQNFMNYACAANAKQKHKYSEAFNWVQNKKNDYIFSFDNVCEALGLNPEWVRLG